MRYAPLSHREESLGDSCCKLREPLCFGALVAKDFATKALRREGFTKRSHQ